MGVPRSSEPRSGVSSTKKRPGTPPVTTGGVSSASKWRWDFFDSPICMPMYAPERRVPSPETLAPEIRGRTTQNCVSSTRKPSVLGAICAVVITLRWSSERRISVSVPTWTPLYSILGLPASSPSADWNTIVTFGPSPRIRVTATQAPAPAATIGISQTSERRVRLRLTALDSGARGSGRSLSGMADLPGARGIPDQSGIEGFDGQHRQHHDRREEEETWRRRHRHQGLELHQCRGEGVDEDVDHRPAPDQLDRAIEPDALPVVLDGAPLDADQQVDERQDLGARDHDARDEHDQGERPSGRGPEELDALQDRVRVAPGGRAGRHHREDVGRDAADRSRNEASPGALQARGLAEGELLVAARAATLLLAGLGAREQAAGLAALQPQLHRRRRNRGGSAHRVASAISPAPALRALASAQSTRSHTSRGSKPACMAASTKTRAPSAYIATPGITVASSAILISATSTPSIITSIMLQVRVVGWWRRSVPTQAGGCSRRAPSRIASMKAIWSPGAITAAKSTSPATICSPSRQSCWAPPSTVVWASRPTTVRPSMGKVLATAKRIAAASASGSVRWRESSRRRHSSRSQRGHCAEPPGWSSGRRCTRSQCGQA